MKQEISDKRYPLPFSRWEKGSGYLLLLLAFSTSAFAGAPKFDFGLELREFTVLQHNYADSTLGRTLEGYELFLLRMKLQANFSEELLAELHLVQQAELRSQASTINFFGFSVSGVPSLYIIDELNWHQVDEEAWQFNLFPDRGNFSTGSEHLRLTVGRQAVSFGKTFFWNSTDWLTPFTVNTLDRDYKPGADIIRLDSWLTPMQKLSLYYAFGSDAEWDESALLASYNLSQMVTDFELLAGKLKEDFRIGGSISSTPTWLGGGALRAELAFYLPMEEPDENFTRATLGYDFQFRNSLYLLMEYHYNGFGANDVDDYALRTLDAHFQNGEITQVAEHYLGVNGRYDLTALLKINGGLIINLIDASLALTPGFTYSVADEVDLVLGTFLVVGERPDGGAAQSEFGLYPSYGSLELVVAF